MKRFAAPALVAAVASSCGPSVPQPSPAVDLGTLSQAEVDSSSQPDACAGATGTTAAASWIAGPFVVSGGANARGFSFDNLVVLLKRNADVRVDTYSK